MEDKHSLWIDSKLQLWRIAAERGNSHVLIGLSIQVWGIPESDSDSAGYPPTQLDVCAPSLRIFLAQGWDSQRFACHFLWMAAACRPG